VDLLELELLEVLDEDVEVYSLSDGSIDLLVRIFLVEERFRSS